MYVELFALVQDVCFSIVGKKFYLLRNNDRIRGPEGGAQHVDTGSKRTSEAVGTEDSVAYRLTYTIREPP